MTSASRHIAAARPGRAEGRVLGLTRAGVWVLFVLAAANGLFLYFVPGRADTDYAWSIKPAVNAAFIGAGFLAGTLATGLVLWRATRWRSFSLLPPALWVLATTCSRRRSSTRIASSGTTRPRGCGRSSTPACRWRSRFWSARQRRVAEPLPAADPALRVLRVLSGSPARCLIAGAAALYLAPVELGEHWLWPLTPLLARAVAAWYALFGTMLLTFALAQRRRSRGYRLRDARRMVRASARAAAATPRT